MGGAILLGACLTGLQGLRCPLSCEPAEAAGTNNVVSKAAGVDVAYREPGRRLPRRRYEDMTKAPREPGIRLPRSRLRRQQYEDTTLAHREPASRLPRSRLTRQFDDMTLSSQGARQPAATEPAAATTVRQYDASSQVAREPASTKTAATITVRRYNVSSQEAGQPAQPALMEPVKTTVRRHFHHVLYIALADCLISVYLHTSTAAAQLTVNCVRSCFYTDRLARM